MNRIRLFACVTALLVLCTGCSMDVENFLQPPAAQGEQKSIQNALETYINDSGDSSRRYTLQYPSEGTHTSAFIVCDEAGKPVEDANAIPSLAVAFYLFSGANEEVHINLLRRDGEDWISVSDISGFGSDIRQVAFGDLNGDGQHELLAGFGTYNSRDYRLTVLSMENELSVLDDTRLYTRLFVGDMMGTGSDSLLTLRIAAANTVTATLSVLRDGRLRTVDTVSLDGYIQQFHNMLFCPLDERVNGLYIDAEKTGDTRITELVYYDGEHLRAPFYDKATNTTTATARRHGLAVRDIDGDGRAEIPRGTAFPGYAEDATLPSTAFLTTWLQYDLTQNTLQEHLHTVVNTMDGYFVSLDDTQRARWTTVYEADSSTLTLQDAESGDVYMRLVPYADTLPIEYQALFPATDNAAGVAVQYDEGILNMQKVRYMVSRLL